MFSVLVHLAEQRSEPIESDGVDRNQSGGAKSDKNDDFNLHRALLLLETPIRVRGVYHSHARPGPARQTVADGPQAGYNRRISNRQEITYHAPI